MLLIRSEPPTAIGEARENATDLPTYEEPSARVHFRGDPCFTALNAKGSFLDACRLYERKRSDVSESFRVTVSHERTIDQ